MYEARHCGTGYVKGSERREKKDLCILRSI